MSAVCCHPSSHLPSLNSYAAHDCHMRPGPSRADDVRPRRWDRLCPVLHWTSRSSRSRYHGPQPLWTTFCDSPGAAHVRPTGRRRDRVPCRRRHGGGTGSALKRVPEEGCTGASCSRARPDLGCHRPSPSVHLQEAGADRCIGGRVCVRWEQVRIRKPYRCRVYEARLRTMIPPALCTSIAPHQILSHGTMSNRLSEDDVTSTYRAGLRGTFEKTWTQSPGRAFLVVRVLLARSSSIAYSEAVLNAIR
jgi:hypothetical protein